MSAAGVLPYGMEVLRMMRTTLALLALTAGCSPKVVEVDASSNGQQAADAVEAATAPVAEAEPVESAQTRDVAWELMDVSALPPLQTGPCDEQVAQSYAEGSTRDAEAATQIHRAALGCVEAEQWDVALELAKALRRRDWQPVDAYVSATVLAAYRATVSNPCEIGMVWEIVYSAHGAAGPEYSARMLADANFEPAYRSYRWRLATMPGDDRAAERMQGTSWYNCGGCGMYGDTYQYHFEAGGLGTYRSAEPTEDGEGLVWSEEPLTWVLDASVMTVTMGQEQITMTLQPDDGHLVLESGRVFRDYEDRCGA